MPTVASLQDFSHTNFTFKEFLVPNKLNSRFGRIQNRVNDLIDVSEWLESKSAGTSAPQPNVRRGRLWADTTNTGRVVLKLDPDGLGADDEVMTRLESQNISFTTAGTATMTPGGVVYKDTTAVSLSAGGSLMGYTIPAGTLDTNGMSIKFIGWGTKTNANATATINTEADSGVYLQTTLLAAATDWRVEFNITRVAADGHTTYAIMRQNSDAAGGTKDCNISKTASGGLDFTSDFLVEWKVFSVDASDSITMDGLIAMIMP